MAIQGKQLFPNKSNPHSNYIWIKSTVWIEWASLGETAIYPRLNGALGCFFPRWKWLKWFVYTFVARLVLLLRTKHKLFWQCFPFKNLYPHILLCCILRDSSQFTILVSFFLCFPPILLDAFLTSSNTVFCFVCLLQTAVKLKTSILNNSKILWALLWPNQLLDFLQSQFK